MKKTILLFSSLLLLSCSNDDNSTPSIPNNPPTTNNTVEGTILKSYKFNSTAGTEHFFENGSRYDKIIANNVLTTKFEYDANNKMTKKIEYLSNGITVGKTTTFFYNSLNKIFKIEILNGTTLKTILYTYSGNTITGEVVGNSSNPNGFNPSRIRYTFNTSGLISAYQKYSVDEQTLFEDTNKYSTLNYDNNNNVTSIKISFGGTHDLPNSNPTTTSIFSLTYDNKINPVEKIYTNHYLNYILMQFESFDFDYPFGSTFRTYGKNNQLETNYPTNYIYAKYRSENTYQTNNLIKTSSSINLANNTAGSVITFNYVN